MTETHQQNQVEKNPSDVKIKTPGALKLKTKIGAKKQMKKRNNKRKVESE